MSRTPGWYEDPFGGGQVRWWDGGSWTPHVAHPVPSDRPTPRQVPTLPLRAAVGGLAVTVVALVGSRLVLELLVGYRWPVVAYVAIGGLLGYGPLVGWCALVVRRWGGGSWAEALGVRGRAIDAAWGPTTWLACLAAQVATVTVVVALGVPLESNTEGIDGLAGERGYVLALAVLAVIAAPVVEELLFRGVVLRGLCSTLPVGAAVSLQGVLFGVAHVDPARGVGNIGLVMVLSSVGVVLGGSAVLLGRLVPAMVAHAIINTVALVVVLTGAAG